MANSINEWKPDQKKLEKVCEILNDLDVYVNVSEFAQDKVNEAKRLIKEVIFGI